MARATHDNTAPTLHAIRSGEAYDGRCSHGGCILRRAHADGLRISSPDGDVVISVADVSAELAKLGLKVRRGQ